MADEKDNAIKTVPPGWAREETDTSVAEQRLDSDRLVGELISDRYRIERRIGRGGMGVVYLASQEALNRKVVLKVLTSQLHEDVEAVGRFEREALQLSLLQHPNIVTIYDFGRDRGLAYIVMEFVEGDTLTELIQKTRGEMSFAFFAPIAAQILEALHEAHSRGVVHRDIKPSNIMLCERHGHDNFIKVLDFGLAKLIDDVSEITKSNNLVGSVAFLSPEQILGLDIDQRVDVYALGVLFYYMLCGEKPFVADDDIGVLYQHIHSRPQLLSERLLPDHDIPHEIVDVIHRCLAKAPEDRPADARAILDSFTDGISRSNFQLPWASSDLSSGSFPGLARPHFPTPIGVPRSGPVAVADRHSVADHDSTAGLSDQTPHNRYSTGDYAAVAQPATAPAVSDHDPDLHGHAAPPRRPLLIAGALALAVALAAGVYGSGILGDSGATTTTSSVAAEDPALAGAAFDELLGRAEELIGQNKFGQAQILLDSVQDRLSQDPERLVQISSLQDRIATGKMLLEADELLRQGDRAGARELYRQILTRDSTHAAARQRLDELESVAPRPPAPARADADRSPRPATTARKARKAPAPTPSTASPEPEKAAPQPRDTTAVVPIEERPPEEAPARDPNLVPIGRPADDAPAGDPPAGLLPVE